MEKDFGPFHRLGKPGGQGCKVSAIEISLKAPDGTLIPGMLLDAGADSTEVELLRTIAFNLGIQWGKDELGWWACVPNIVFEEK